MLGPNSPEPIQYLTTVNVNVTGKATLCFDDEITYQGKHTVHY